MSANKAIIIKRIKKHGGGGHHGGAWKVAYADFVTAMMAFFLLLWLLNMTSDEKRIRLSQYFKHFSIYDQGGTSFMGKSSEIFGEAGESRQKAFTVKHKQTTGNPDNMDVILYKLGDEIDKDLSNTLGDLKDQVSLDITDEGLRIQMFDSEGTVMFEKGSTTLTEKAKQIIQRIAENLNNHKQNVLIDGHTDSEPFLREGYSNWELSSERALAARKELEKNNFDPERVARVAGFSHTSPLVKDNPADPRNRRITFTLRMPHREKDERKLTGDIKQLKQAAEELQQIIEKAPPPLTPIEESGMKKADAAVEESRPNFNIFKWNPFRRAKREPVPGAGEEAGADKKKRDYDDIIQEGQFNAKTGSRKPSLSEGGENADSASENEVKGPSMIEELTSVPIEPVISNESGKDSERSLFNILKWNPFKSQKKEALPDTREESRTIQKERDYDTIINEGQSSSTTVTRKSTFSMGSGRDTAKEPAEQKNSSPPTMIDELSPNQIAPVFSKDDLFSTPADKK